MFFGSIKMEKTSSVIFSYFIISLLKYMCKSAELCNFMQFTARFLNIHFRKAFQTLAKLSYAV